MTSTVLVQYSTVLYWYSTVKYCTDTVQFSTVLYHTVHCTGDQSAERQPPPDVPSGQPAEQPTAGGPCPGPGTAQCTLCGVQCTVYSVQCTAYSVQCTVYSVHCTVYSVQCVVCSVLALIPQRSALGYVVTLVPTFLLQSFSTGSVLCTLYSVLCNVYCVFCTVYY